MARYDIAFVIARLLVLIRMPCLDRVLIAVFGVPGINRLPRNLCWWKQSAGARHREPAATSGETNDDDAFRVSSGRGSDRGPVVGSCANGGGCPAGRHELLCNQHRTWQGRRSRRARRRRCALSGAGAGRWRGQQDLAYLPVEARLAGMRKTASGRARGRIPRASRSRRISKNCTASSSKSTRRLRSTKRDINGRGDTPNQHDMLTGTQQDGTAVAGPDDATCSNWTSSAEGQGSAHR